MKNTHSSFYIRLLILLFLQLFVADYFNYLSDTLIYFQVLAVIWLPIHYSFIGSLPIILSFAAIIDLFNHTLGLNLIACTFLLYLRTYFISFLLEKEDEAKIFHIYTVGLKPFVYYVLLVNIVFYSTIFSVEFFRWSYGWSIFYKWGVGILGMTAFSIVLDYMLMRPRKKK
jgi:hypothetical protein